jgi:hypothetical protein
MSHRFTIAATRVSECTTANGNARPAFLNTDVERLG